MILKWEPRFWDQNVSWRRWWAAVRFGSSVINRTGFWEISVFWSRSCLKWSLVQWQEAESSADQLTVTFNNPLLAPVEGAAVSERTVSVFSGGWEFRQDSERLILGNIKFQQCWWNNSSVKTRSLDLFTGSGRCLESLKMFYIMVRFLKSLENSWILSHRGSKTKSFGHKIGKKQSVLFWSGI